jgi:3-oxoacyl-[acyl-carrier-protein] synthase-3
MLIDYYLPENAVTNEMLASSFESWDYQSFEKKVGIKTRHISLENETALDLAEKACVNVLSDFDKSKIDFVLLCTQSPDYFLPTSACELQHRLGLPNSCGALDFNLGCSGFVYGLSLAKGLLSAGIANNVLLTMAETYSKHIHPNDRSNRAIFGDAASAIIVNKDNLNLGEFILGTNGKGRDELIVRNGAFKNKGFIPAETYEYGTGNITSDDHLYMNGPSIFNFTIETVPPLVEQTLKKNKLTLDQVDYYIFHQANQFMLEYLRKKIKISPEKFCIDMADYGNTVSSTIPIALTNAIRNGKVKKGDKVMLVGFGVGLSWGATIITI